MKKHLLHSFYQYYNFYRHFIGRVLVKIMKIRGRPNKKFFVGLVIPLKYTCNTPKYASECLLYGVFFNFENWCILA